MLLVASGTIVDLGLTKVSPEEKAQYEDELFSVYHGFKYDAERWKAFESERFYKVGHTIPSNLT